ncbi:MAG: amidohydrolase family protein, partial [Spirochaetes bacterium]|nr:amidohydrolase family protein [Spirochaetota bacterium]
ADARAMLDNGCAVALASDFNPGSCYSQSIPLAIALAVLYMKMSTEEVLTALTLNGAAALKLAHDRGSLEAGKLADILILDAPSYKHLAYHSGMNLVDTVIKRGKVVSVAH